MIKRLSYIAGALLITIGVMLGSTPAKATTYYTIVLAYDQNWALTVYGPHGYSRAPVVLYYDYANSSQGWLPIEISSDIYVLQFEEAGTDGTLYCLDDPGDTKTDNVQYMLWPCTYNDRAEQFQPLGNSAGGTTWANVNGTTVEDQNYYVVNNNPITTWHYVQNAPYELWCGATFC